MTLPTVHMMQDRTNKQSTDGLANIPHDTGHTQQAGHRRPCQQSTRCRTEPTSSPQTSLPKVHKMQDQNFKHSTDGLTNSPQDAGQNQQSVHSWPYQQSTRCRTEPTISPQTALPTVHMMQDRINKPSTYGLANIPHDAGQNQQAVHRRPCQQSTRCMTEPTSSPQTALTTVHKMQDRTNKQSTDSLANNPQDA